VDELVEKLRSDEARVLADDEVGLIIYVGDLEYYNLTPTETGEFLAQPVTQVSRPRFPVNVCCASKLEHGFSLSLKMPFSSSARDHR
jgi:hypothetical protein